MRHPRADRRAAGRRLSRPPGARLSRRLHAVAGAVAEAAGRPLGRPGAVGGAAARLRPRARDRDIQGAGILVDRWPSSPPPRTRPSGARLVAIDGKKLDKFDIADEATADAPQGGARRRPLHRRRASRARRSAATRPPPFTTSTLQQEASRKLGFSPRHTMQLAQRLYEGVDIGGESEGLITYMRTDGVQIAPEAIAAVRAHRRASSMASATCPRSPRQYETKAKNAQEAHEAIRPTDFTKPPDKVARYLDDDAGQALQADLAAHAGEPGLERRDRAHHRRDRRHRQGRQALRPARHRLGHPLRRLPQALRGRAATTRSARTAPCPRSTKGDALDPPQDRGEAAFHRAAAALHRGDA